MEKGFSFWQILWESDLVVKAVLFALVGLSIYSWYIIFKKKRILKELRINNKKFMDFYSHSDSLKEISQSTSELANSSCSTLFRYGYDEILKMSEKGSNGKTGREVIENHFKSFGFDTVERALKRGIQQSNEILEDDLSALASVGSISPFIGLFGTVWGIIHSFSGLSGGGTSIDAVAPGIAEALIATAIGIAAAIPAVWFYNYFSNENSKELGRMESFGQEFLNMVERSIVK